MVESVETRSTPGLAAINAFVRGSYAPLCSSNKLGWDEFIWNIIGCFQLNETILFPLTI